MNKFQIARKSFMEAAKILSAQKTDPIVSTPRVRIEPQETIVEKAVSKITNKIGNYFVGVSTVKTDNSISGYGETRSDDPTIFYLNLGKFKNEVFPKIKQMNPNASPQDLEDLFANAIAETLAHEKGHMKDVSQTGVLAPESVAEQEAERTMSQIVS